MIGHLGPIELILFMVILKQHMVLFVAQFLCWNTFSDNKVIPPKPWSGESRLICDFLDFLKISQKNAMILFHERPRFRFQ